MAEIYRFPGVCNEFADSKPFSPQEDDGRKDRRMRSEMLQRFEGANVPSAVRQAVESVREMPRIAGMTYSEMPTPSSIADYGIGVEIQYPIFLAESMKRMQSEASLYGWIMILFVNSDDVTDRSPWQCVAYMREPKLETDFDDAETQALLTTVQERLHNADAYQISGTVSSTENHSFGMDESKIQDSYEIRASWTPEFRNGESDSQESHSQEYHSAAYHVQLWSQLMLDFGVDLMDQRDSHAAFRM
ncbi:MAG: DUF3000 family protein [Bifidobacterium sp.]|uniref:DUF3000 family protein n=1 Tax=Bifidobacterium fermentum TaxID=3059035 RepID=A0AB39UEF2_9BIFI